MDEKISIVLPTYNEIENIQKMIENVQQVLEKITSDYEVIIVDDNSPDGTGEFAQNLSNGNERLKVIIREEKTGIGDAYKCGFQRVTGDKILQMDADFSHNPKDIPRFVKALEFCDIVIGSRYIKGGGNLLRNKTRIVISRIANFLASFFFGLQQTDSTTGYRAYKKEVIDTILPHVNSQNFVFQVEMLEKAKQFHFSVREIPIKFKDRSDGESKFNLGEILQFLKQLIMNGLQIAIFNKIKRKKGK